MAAGGQPPGEDRALTAPAEERSLLRRLVLVGGGGAHVQLLRSFARPLARGLEIVLVAPQAEYHHPPMMSGLLRGVYTPADARVDLLALAERAGARVVLSRADRIDSERRLVLAGTERIPFDACSVDLVSEAQGLDLPGVAEYAVPLRPVERIVEARASIEAAIEAVSTPLRCMVVGAGTTGIEAAFALQRRIARSGRGGVVTIVEAGRSILADAAPCAEFAHALLERQGVCFALGARVLAVRPEGVELSSGAILPADLVLWATGAAVPEVVRGSDLFRDAEGRLLVDEGCRAVDGAPVWGVGDGVAMREGDSDRGRQAPRGAQLLERELRAALGAPASRSGRARRAPCLIDTGDGRAIGEWGPFRGHTRLGGWLKRRRDRRFVAV